MLDQIVIKGVHYHVSDTTEQFIQNKLDKFDYLNHLILDGEIRIIKEMGHYKVEANLHLRRNHRIHLETTQNVLYPAIENLIHKLKKVLSDEHSKYTSHKFPDLKHHASDELRTEE